MSPVLKLIEDFPRGRSTGELQRLLGIDRSPSRKRDFQAELTELVREGLIEIGPNRKWLARSRRAAPEVPPIGPKNVSGEALFEPLFAAPVGLHQVQRVALLPP